MTMNKDHERILVFGRCRGNFGGGRGDVNKAIERRETGGALFGETMSDTYRTFEIYDDLLELTTDKHVRVSLEKKYGFKQVRFNNNVREYTVKGQLHIPQKYSYEDVVQIIRKLVMENNHDDQAAIGKFESEYPDAEVDYSYWLVGLIVCVLIAMMMIYFP